MPATSLTLEERSCGTAAGHLPGTLILVALLVAPAVPAEVTAQAADAAQTTSTSVPTADAQDREEADEALQALEVNRDELVEMAVRGTITDPTLRDPPYRINPEGEVKSLPGTGGITYNFRVGDSAVDLAGDHVEPSVSIGHYDGGGEEVGLNAVAQVGNRARVISGEAQGAEGTVIGKHGGIENVMVEFPDETYEELAIGDQIQVRGLGLGMEAQNVEDLYIRNVGVQLLDALTESGMGVTDEGQLQVPVTHVIPAKIMGSGLGARDVATGDYDIQMFDEEMVEEYDLDTLRFGDIVAITDADHRHGRIYRGGAVSIGVVAHGYSREAGHGPGVTSLFTSPEGNIEPVRDADANLSDLLDIP